MNRTTMLLGALLLVLFGSGCPSEKTPRLELVEPKLAPGIDVSGWAAPTGDAPTSLAWPVEGATFRLVLTEEVEQRAPESVELHAKVEIEADVLLSAVDGGLSVTVSSPKVKLTPPLEGRPDEIAKALDGATGTIHRTGGKVSFTPADSQAHIREIMSAIAWLLPPDAVSGHPATEPWSTTTIVQMGGLDADGSARVEAKARLAGTEGSRSAVRFELGVASTGAQSPGGATGSVTGEGKGHGQAVLDGGALERSDVAVNLLAAATIQKGTEEVVVQQLVRLDASLVRRAR